MAKKSKSKTPSKLLAIDWDDQDLRVALGKSSGDRIQLLRAETISRHTRVDATLTDPNSTDADATDSKPVPIDGLLAEWVSNNGASGSEVLVAISRSDVELRLSLIHI